ncbi:tRNA (guanine-N(7)-)-methyltransferase non-catalytic subunit wdr4 [Anabrus simplex]|uniref:tRNA (guanine-N(7)-)-methyltransferase non-catalytic subunit wdr4 n=1 Tax=Anabrus simplex TaxID=316456 RepID=UPI0035A2DF35
MEIMASLSINNNILVVSCGTKVLVSNRNEDTFNILEPPGLVGKIADKMDSDEEVKSEQKDTPASVVCVDLSRCNKWLAVCSSNKQLSLWSADNRSLLSNRVLTRTASKVKFTPSGRGVVVADKSGDAYLYSVQNPESEGDFLLGHLSMLLDVLITSEENYIITCDRDEKIRVSLFPNSYNIQSFCLGHTEFVSCIALVPHCAYVLVSGSGDGTLRFWNYVNGCQLSMIECSRNINMHCFSGNFLKQNTKQHTGGVEVSEDSNTQQSDICVSSNSLAVTQFSSCAIDKNSSLIAACISRFDGIAVYHVSGGTSNITVNFLEVVTIGVEPWAVHFSGVLLWCLAAKENHPLSVFEFSYDSLHFEFIKDNCDKKNLNILSQVNNKWELFKDICAPSLTPILYKRTVDNLQEYQEKKKARLASNI